MHREIKIFTDTFFRFFQPVIAAAATPSNAKALMLNLGYLPPEQFTVFDNFRARVNSIRDVIEAMAELSEEDIEANPQLLLDAIRNGVESISGLISDIQNLPSIIQSELNGSDLLAQTDILESLPLKLFDFLTIRYLKEHQNRIYSALKLLGIIEVKEIRNVSNPFHFPHLEWTFHWDKTAELLTSPMELLKTSLKDNNGYFYEKTMQVLQEVGLSIGVVPHYRDPEPDVLKFINNDPLIDTWLGFKDLEILRFPLIPRKVNSLGLDIYPLINTADNRIKGLVSVLRLDPGEKVFVISDKHKLEIEVSGLANGLGIVLDENDEFRFLADLFASPQNLPNNVQFEFRATLTRNEETDGNNTEKLFQLGTADGNRFEVGSYNVSFGIEKRQNARLFLETELLNGFIRMKFDGADGFISKVLGDGIESEFSFGLGFSNDQGFYFAGSSGLEIELPTHTTLGPLKIRNLSVSITSTEEKITFTFTSSVLVNAGPLRLLVQNIGVSFPGKSDTAVFVPNVTFKPPTALGLSIDGGGFKGGGFLDFEPEQERYSGFFELEYQDQFTLKAFGLLTTRLPNGQSGFSLLIVISSEFTPIQLGFGFKLNGVGGLLGLNRTVKVEPLRAGLRDNTLGSILFPTDIIANADRILSDLRQIFPPQEGRFVFGPMAKITWGTPVLLSVDLGLVIEIPDPVRLLILGVVRGILPDEQASILRLQVNFLGEINFEQQQLSFDASLFDSKLLAFTLTGDMALRLYWGAEANFLLTVGGFHPAYQPPPMNLPSIRRLTLALLQGDNPRLTLDMYFAVTSNTMQFGARLELYAAAWKFNVNGFLSFDVLFQFNPFYFVADITAMLALRVGSSSIASIKLTLTLEGPTPWKANGTAKFRICWFFTLKIRFNKTFGEARNTSLPDLAVLPLLLAALSTPDNWESELPASKHRLESLKEVAALNQLFVHPLGTLKISQKVVPLNLRIDRLGSQRPSDAREFQIRDIELANIPIVNPGPAQEAFAPAQYFDMNDEEKLASPSFKNFDSGVRIGEPDKLHTAYAAAREVQYELKYIDSQRDRRLVPQQGLFEIDPVVFNTWTLQGAIAKSELSFARKRKSSLAPEAVAVVQEPFAIVNTVDLTLFDETSLLGSARAALARVNALIATNPALKGSLQVIPAFEANS